MSRHPVTDKQFREAFLRELRCDVATGERITSVVTETVPSQFPARLLFAVTELSPQPVEETTRLDAAVAIEFAVLHQYLHAIPRTTSRLEPPASHSEYADDEVAAILDGDFLQACAFSRLTDAASTPERGERYYDWLSTASVQCYERLTTGEQPHTSDTVAPISRVAGKLGAVMGGLDEQRADAVGAASDKLATTVPIRMPGGWTRTDDDVRFDSVLDRLHSALGVSPGTDQLEELVASYRERARL